MARLKKLSIFGFKSFAEKVSLEFDANVIAIVGPNGCGKSNVVDAFRFVMGDIARSLRGEKMEDLLFAGSESKSPLNYAEVSITLTDIEGDLPIDYSEVTISRKLYRTGESEYSINKNIVRLKDIHQLLLGSGVGKHAISIFEQGKLDEVISRSPYERRVIFDECAGTLGFAQKKAELQRNLTQTEANLVRLVDLRDEVEKQSKSLKKQASFAKSFLEKKERLTFLESEVCRLKLEDLTQKQTELQKTYSLLEESLIHLHNLIENEEKEEKQLKKLIDTQYEGLSLTHKTHYEKKSSLEFKKNEQERLDKEVDNFLQKKHQTDMEIQSLKDQIVKKSEEETAKHHQETTTRQGKEKLEKELINAKEDYENCEEKNLPLQASLKKQKENSESLRDEISKVTTRLQEFLIRKENASEELKKILLESEEKKKMLEEKSLLAKEKKEQVVQLLSQIEEVKEQIQSLEEILKSLTQTFETKKQEESLLNKKIAELEGWKKSYLSFQEEFVGFSSGAKQLLKESKKKKSPLYDKLKPFYEFMSAGEGYEKSFRAIVRPYTETLVVKNKKDLETVLTFAKEEKIEGFSLFCEEDLKSNFHNSPIVENNSFSAHFFHSVAVVENFDFDSYQSQKYVTKDGDILDDRRVFFIGENISKDKDLFSRKAELKKLETSLEKFHLQKHQLEGELTEKEIEKKEKEKHIFTLKEKMRLKEIEHLKENFALTRLTAELEEEKKKIQSLNEKQQKIKSQMVLFSESIEQHENCKKNLTHNLQEVLQIQEELRKKEEVLLSEIKLLKKLCDEKQTLFQRAFALWQHSLSEQKIFTIKNDELKERVKRREKELSSLIKEIEKSQLKKKNVEEEILAVNEEFSELQKEIEKEQQTLSQAKQRWEEFRNELFEKRNKAEEKKREKLALQHQLEKNLSERNAIEEKQKNISLENLPKDLFPTLEKNQLFESEKEMTALSLELKRFSSLNLSSIEEYNESEKRFNTLSAQVADIEAAKKDLEQIIIHLEQESRKILKKAFEEIRENFRQNFQILFNGGEADVLWMGSDILEAGVEIVAKPQGKQMRSISLLSGGERCLTALALLFAIFKVKPAPFCVLDEVDAPLDDANVERLKAMILQFAEKTQFVLVTHNKKTMAMADILFGVSMEEKGVSRLISLSFETSKRTVKIEK